MPNRRGTTIEPGELETANPWDASRFAGPEPQERRGQPGSRDIGDLAAPREEHSAQEMTGVNPLPPIDPSMPLLKPGDQGG